MDQRPKLLCFSAQEMDIEIWGQDLETFLAIHTLQNGWFTLEFNQEEHVIWFLTRYWHIEMTPILLKYWAPLFNPEHEKLGAGSVWVHLLGVPMQLWTEGVFCLIGDSLGQYMEYDKSYLETNIMSYL